MTELTMVETPKSILKNPPRLITEYNYGYDAKFIYVNTSKEQLEF